MNPKQALLTRARALVSSGTSYHICYAIGYSCQNRADRKLANGLKALIATRLHPYATLEAWLMYKKGIKLNCKRGFNPATQAKLLETRLAWIDSLIEEFK